MEIHDITQRAANKTIPKKKKSTKAEWLSEGALQIAEERKEAKSKGERERLEISLGKLEISREHLTQRQAQ